MSFTRQIAPLFLIASAFFMLACSPVQETTNAYTKARPAADEAAILMTLRTIADAQQTYFARNGNSYGTFDQLADAGAIDGRFRGAKPVVNGYAFTMNVASSAPGGQPSLTYSVNADPQPANNPQATGTRHFFMDSNGVIHYNESRAASASDPVVQ